MNLLGSTLAGDEPADVCVVPLAVDFLEFDGRYCRRPLEGRGLSFPTGWAVGGCVRGSPLATLSRSVATYVEFVRAPCFEAADFAVVRAATSAAVEQT